MNDHLAKLSALALAFVLPACSPAAQNNTATAPTHDAAPTVAAAPNHADWAGKWVGVEGMYVEITPKPGGGYSLAMQSDLDTLGTYDGTDTADGIAFERGGKPLLLKAATGDETGLKYLAGKTDCLMVAHGEGYCRG